MKLAGSLPMILWLLAGALAGAVPAEEAPALLLRGGRLITMTEQGTIEADLLIREGKIRAIGGEVDAGSARRIDISGMTVTPGLIDARSTLWLTARASSEGAADGSLDALDGVDLFGPDWQEVARHGVTTVYIQPSENGILGGGGAVLRVAPAASLDDLVIVAPAAVQAALGTSGNSRTSRDRFAQNERLQKAFEAAQKYGEAWDKYNAYQAEQKKKQEERKDSEHSQKDKQKEKANQPAPDEDQSQEPAEDSDGADEKDKTDEGTPSDEEKEKADGKAATPPPKPTRDPAKDLLLKVLREQLPLRLEAHREDDIRNALRLADHFDINVILEGLSNPGGAIESLKNARVPLVLGPIYPGRRERSLFSQRALQRLLKHDPRWTLASFERGPRGSRLLRAHAAAAVARGLARERVLRAVTRDAAELLGIGDQRGAIRRGHVADLAVFAGDPLDPSVPVRLTVSGGKITHEVDVSARPSLRAEATVSLPDQLPVRFALRSQHVLGPDGRVHAATLVIDNGKLCDAGADTIGSSSWPLIDVGQCVITPGLFLANSRHADGALSGDSAEAAMPEIRAADAFDRSHPALRRLLAAGVLRLGLAPGTRGVFAGHVALIRLGVEHPLLERDAALQIVLSSEARLADRYPSSLAGQIEVIQRALSGDPVPSSLLLPAVLRRDLRSARQELVSSLGRGRLPAWIRADTAAEVDAACRLAERFQLRAVLVEPGDIAQLAERETLVFTGCIVRPVSSDDYHRSLAAYVQLDGRGMALAFTGSSADEMRLTAALCVAAGMAPERALAGLTRRGVFAAGLSSPRDREETTPADLVVWDGSPLDLQSRPLAVVVGGRRIHTGDEDDDEDDDDDLLSTN